MIGFLVSEAAFFCTLIVVYLAFLSGPSSPARRRRYCRCHW